MSSQELVNGPEAAVGLIVDGRVDRGGEVGTVPVGRGENDSREVQMGGPGQLLLEDLLGGEAGR